MSVLLCTEGSSEEFPSQKFAVSWPNRYAGKPVPFRITPELFSEICNSLGAACPKSIALLGCQQLGLKWGTSDLEGLLLNPLPHTEVYMHYPKNHATSCPMDLERGGGARHSSWELRKERKSLHFELWWGNRRVNRKKRRSLGKFIKWHGVVQEEQLNLYR